MRFWSCPVSGREAEEVKWTPIRTRISRIPSLVLMQLATAYLASQSSRLPDTCTKDVQRLVCLQMGFFSPDLRLERSYHYQLIVKPSPSPQICGLSTQAADHSCSSSSQSPFYPISISLPLISQAAASIMSSSFVHFEPSRLMHSSYDFPSYSLQVSIRLQNTVSDFMNLVRQKQACASQINDFIAFVDDDRILPFCRPLVPEFRLHPSESDKVFSSHFAYACPNLENTDMTHVLQALAHRLPATPGGECPTTEEQRAFRETYRAEFDEMKAAEDEMAEQLGCLAAPRLRHSQIDPALRSPTR
jgi:hypothetical protein